MHADLKHALAALMLIIFLSGCNQDPTVQVTVYVQDEQGKPVEGATVNAYTNYNLGTGTDSKFTSITGNLEASTRTDKEGRARMQLLPGNYAFRAQKEGANGVTEKLVIAGSDAVSITMKAESASPTSISVVPKSCSDSDLGQNIYLQGYTTTCLSDGSCDTKVDTCIKAQGRDNVEENYCKNKSREAALYECTKGCEKGACLTTTLDSVSIRSETTKKTYAPREKISLTKEEGRVTANALGKENSRVSTGMQASFSEASFEGSTELEAEIASADCTALKKTLQEKVFTEEAKKDALLLTEGLIMVSRSACTRNDAFYTAEVKPLIKLREQLLSQLIEENPGRAILVKEVPQGLKPKTVPKGTIPVPELRGKFEGYLDVLHIDDFEDPTKSRFEYYLRPEEQRARYKLFSTTGFVKQFPNARVEVQGLALGNKLAADDTPEKTQVILQPPTPQGKNLGEQKLLVIVANIGDSKVSYTREYVDKLMFGEGKDTVKEYYNENSFGKASITGVTKGIYNLDKDTCITVGIGEAALKAAYNDGVDVSSFDRLVVFSPSAKGCTGYCGSASLGMREDYLFPDGKKRDLSFSHNICIGLRTPAHELGHNFGLEHANNYSCTKNGESTALPNSDYCRTGEYGDPYSVMGNSPKGSLNAAHRSEAGWLSTENTKTATEGTFVIKPINTTQAAGAIQQLRVPIEVETNIYAGENGLYYSIEQRDSSKYYDDYGGSDYYKEKLGTNPVLMHLAKASKDGKFTFMQTNILDMQQRTIFKDGLTYRETLYPLRLGNTFADKLNGYNITLDKTDSQGAHVTVKRIPAATPDFQKPVVHYDFEASGAGSTAKDKSGNNIEGKVSGAVFSNGALSFDGKNDYVDIGGYPQALISKNNGFTISALVKIPSKSIYDPGMTIYSADGLGCQIGFNSLYAYSAFETLKGEVFATSTGSSNLKLSPNEWHHIACKYDGKELSVYVDGEKKSQVTETSMAVYNEATEKFETKTFSLSSTEARLDIRRQGRLGASIFDYDWFDGLVDEFQIYARGLSDEEIKKMHESYLPLLGPPKAKKSVIANNGATDVSGTLVFALQKQLPNGEWVRISEKTSIHNDFKLKAGEERSLAELLDQQPISVEQEGNYRLATEFTDITGRKAEGFAEFNVKQA